MEGLSKEQKEKIIQKLREKGVTGRCPMCGNDHFDLVGAYFTNVLQSKLDALSLGGPNVPTIPIVCTRCGFVSQHALGVLNLLPKPKEEGDAAKKASPKK